MKHLIFIMLFIPFILKAQETRPGNLSPVIAKGGFATLSKDWKYKAGDNPDWANPNFDDSSWQSFTNANLYNKEIQEKAKKTNIVWFRKRISIDSTTTQKLVINLYQSGASEIYLDGELIHSLGKVSSNPDSIVCTNQSPVPLSFPMKLGKEQLLAVRFAVLKSTLPLFQSYYEFLEIQVQKEDYAKELLLVASDSLFDSNGILDLGNRDGWRFHPGDEMKWANPNFDDSNWKFYRPSSLTEPIPDSIWNGYGWFRHRFAADSTAYAKITRLYFFSRGAAEVYLDGKLVLKQGVFSSDPRGEKRISPYSVEPPAVFLQRTDSHVLAVRYSYHKGKEYKERLGNYAYMFGFSVGLSTDYLNNKTIAREKIAMQELHILGTMLFLIVLLHLLLYLLFPADRSNLYITILAFLLFLQVMVDWAGLPFDPDVFQIWFVRNIPHIVLTMAALSMIPLTLSFIFNQKPKLIHKIFIWLFPIFALINFILSGPVINIPLAIVLMSFVLFFSYKILYQAWKNKQNGVWIIAGAFLCLILSTVTWILYSSFSQNYWLNLFDSVLFYLIYGSIPIGLTAFMASRFRDLYAHLEQKVHDRTLALEQSLEDLKSTQTQLIQSEKMASLGELTAGIAHEIQNPLNFVNNFSEVNAELIGEMEDEIDKGNLDEAKKIAGAIHENQLKINHHGKRADAIVKGMLQHSRSSSGVRELVDMNKLTDEYLRLSYHGLRAKDKSFNATMKTDFDSSIGKIRIVSDEIGRVILNLLNNAFYAVSEKRKRNPDGYEPTVSISTLKVGDQVEIKVRDNGNGIPHTVLDKIFQPFFTTKPTGMGTGLGLSMAYDIVKAHGGELKVETKGGEGSAFIIHLPI